MTYETATLHEASGRIGALPSPIKPVAEGMRLFGPAFPVSSPGGDNLWLHRALAKATEGDVLVVSVSGQYEFGYWGEVMTVAAKARGLGGLVIDGCVRDSERLRTLGFPVFARGLCIRGTKKDPAGQGALGEPVRIGDVSVSAGDLVAGDADGVVAVPASRVEEVLEKARALTEEESKIFERLEKGETTLDVFGFS